MILDAAQPQAIEAAAQALRRGELLGLPTETVYGLAADADNPSAVAQIFATKGRPAQHPLIVHVAGQSAIAHYASALAPYAQQLLDAFWPGPLTIIVPRLAHAAAVAAGGQDSIGLRCPAHPVARAVLAACQRLEHPIHGIAAPSANRFGRISPTTAAHVAAELGAALLVLDGGACPVGIESTIVDCTRAQPVLLRPGAITRSDIARACGMRALSPSELPGGNTTPRAPGTLAAHYAPRATLRLMDAGQLRTALDILGADARHVAVYHRSALPPHAAPAQRRTMPADAPSAARDLFAALRALDADGIRLIWVETPPTTSAWEAVRDRLQRAAAT